MNGEESELANNPPDPGMIASRDGMRARDPWEMERPAKRKERADLPLCASVENGQIVIRIGLNVLKMAAEYCPLFRDETMAWSDDPYETVVDDAELARDVVSELLREQEDGTTPLHVLFDNAIDAARENGSAGFKESDI